MAESLKKSIGFPGLISLGAGGVIGSSWIYTNSQFFKAYGAGGEIFGLIIAAILAIFVSLSFAELATIFPKSGGAVVYSFVAFGKKGALFAGWALIGAYIATLAFYVTASSLLIGSIFPQISMGPSYHFAGTQVYFSELAIGVAITCSIFVINYFGAKLTGNIQIILFCCLLVLGLVLIIVGFSKGSLNNFLPSFYTHQNASASIFRFILPAMTFLTGWESVAVMAEETKISARKIGLVVLLSIVIAAGYYVAVLASSALILPWQKTAELPMGTISAFSAAGYPLLSMFAYAISFLGLVTSFLTLFAAAPRLLFSLAKEGILPAPLAKINAKHGTPTNALWVVLILVLGLGWLGKGALVYFLDIGGFLIGLAWAFNAAALVKIRHDYPTLKGAFRNRHLTIPVLGGCIAFVIAIATLIPNTPVSLVWPYEYVVLGIWCLFGLFSYWLSKAKDPMPTSIFISELNTTSLVKKETTK